jgi:hypothetical protein
VHQLVNSLGHPKFKVSCRCLVVVVVAFFVFLSFFFSSSCFRLLFVAFDPIRDCKSICSLREIFFIIFLNKNLFPNRFPDLFPDLTLQIIVEGANLFLTQDARLQLEKAGVILYKDSTANKGGVTSSSLEV